LRACFFCFHNRLLLLFSFLSTIRLFVHGMLSFPFLKLSLSCLRQHRSPNACFLSSTTQQRQKWIHPSLRFSVRDTQLTKQAVVNCCFLYLTVSHCPSQSFRQMLGFCRRLFVSSRQLLFSEGLSLSVAIIHNHSSTASFFFGPIACNMFVFQK
jgi:hypothetical protein